MMALQTHSRTFISRISRLTSLKLQRSFASESEPRTLSNIIPENTQPKQTETIVQEKIIEPIKEHLKDAVYRVQHPLSDLTDTKQEEIRASNPNIARADELYDEWNKGRVEQKRQKQQL